MAFPCTDSHTVDFHHNSEYSEIDCTDNHNDVIPNEESCTPFCICSCCSTHLVDNRNQIDFILEYTITECSDVTFATIDQYIQPKVTPPKS